MSRIRVAIAHSPLEWRRDVQRFVAAHVGTLAVSLVRDVRTITESPPDVLLVDARSSLLDPVTVRLVRASDVTLIGVYDRADGAAGRERFADLGVEHFLDVSLPVDEFVRQVEETARRYLRADVPATGLLERSRGTDGDGQRGIVVAVGGPAGAGRTEIVVGLAAETATKVPSLVVDTNETDPHVVHRLQLTMHPHIAAIVEARKAAGARNGSDPLTAGLARPAVGAGLRPVRFDVVAGLPSPREWNTVRPSEVAALLDDARARWRVTFATTSPIIEDLSRWVDRFAVSRRVLSDADRVIGVCEPSPRGVAHFVDWLVELESIRPGCAVDVVVNKVGRGSWHAAEVVGQLREIAGRRIGSVTIARFDRRVATADWDGVLPKSPRWRDAVRPLAASILTQASQAREPSRTARAG
jgi:hypothetical protein